MTPKIIISEVGTPLYLFELIPQINYVKRRCELLDQLFSLSLPLSNLLFNSLACLVLKKVLKVLKFSLYKYLVDTLYTLILDFGEGGKEMDIKQIIWGPHKIIW